MDQLITLLPLIAAAGLAAGFLAGLLGIGGGIVMTPTLYLVFGVTEVDPAIRMHAALATSLGIIVPTAISSVRAHWRRGSVDARLARRWGLPLAIGAAAGAGVATLVDSTTLVLVFASLASVMAIKMLMPLEGIQVADAMPGGAANLVVPGAIGLVSSVMGIGGATFSVPYMTLYGTPMHRAVGTAACLGLVVSVVAVAGFATGGLVRGASPPYSLGFVNLPAVAVVAPLSVLAAPLGARAAHALTRRQLSILFGIFLAASAIRLFLSV